MIRIKDVCELFKVTKPTVYKWIEKGLKSYKVDRLVFLDEQEVEEFIKSGGNTENNKQNNG